VNAGRTARERVRAELTREITEAARRQLATAGAAALSLRAVAREMGMVSSAIYRYFASRDDLLTTLIIESYNALGAAVEDAEAGVARDAFPARWAAACGAIREWALRHPHEYALIYGSPVPGYRAPERTVGPAARSAAVFGKIVADAYRAGAVGVPSRPGSGGGSSAPGSGGWPSAPGSFAADAARLRESVFAGAGVPDDVIARALAAWAGVFGMVSFELFGQFENVITDRGAFFGHAVACLGAVIGLDA
jgi:AcrR family transcriptional regulator